jgi:hypothetical protein
MSLAIVCPECSSGVRTEVHGGLFKSFCASCSWQESGTASYSWQGMPKTVSLALSVRWLSSECSAEALHKLRTLSSSARALSVQELHTRLASGSSFQIGAFPPYRAQDLAQELVAVGFAASLSAQNEASQETPSK